MNQTDSNVKLKEADLDKCPRLLSAGLHKVKKSFYCNFLSVLGLEKEKESINLVCAYFLWNELLR